MKDYLKNITGAAVLGASFAATAATADEVHEDYAAFKNSTVFASMECIEDALRSTFGEKSGIDIDMESGLIMSQSWDNGKPVLAEIYLGFQEAVASLNVTMTDGLATMKANNEFVAPPQGTASLFYRGEEGVPAYMLDGVDQKPLENYLNTLDRHIRSCAMAPLIG